MSEFDWGEEIARGVEVQPETVGTNGHRRGQSRIVQNGSTAYVELTRGLWAAIDASDLALVAGRVWHAQSGKHTFYAKAHAGGDRTVAMHRLIMGESTMIYDHIDGNGLNNRRVNLRECTYAQNAWNRRRLDKNKSGHTGVFFNQKNGRYEAYIGHDGRRINLGRYAAYEDACRAHSDAVKRLYGEFARSSISQD